MTQRVTTDWVPDTEFNITQDHKRIQSQELFQRFSNLNGETTSGKKLDQEITIQWHVGVVAKKQ